MPAGIEVKLLRIPLNTKKHSFKGSQQILFNKTENWRSLLDERWKVLKKLKQAQLLTI